MEIFEEFSRLLAEALSPTIKEIIVEEVPKLISPPAPKYYTVNEVCAKYNICQATFYNWAKRGDITRLYENGIVKVRADEIDTAMATGDLRKHMHKRRRLAVD